ncbi:MAG: hypothetical protein BWY48_00349 [Parcubacteria group bacterium ADurb.Bin305]|nr:MAG: hypothetical protein BWY48_00349 [Parcubacteria group bacterium ADurb.Bin305]
MTGFFLFLGKQENEYDGEHHCHSYYGNARVQRFGSTDQE